MKKGFTLIELIIVVAIIGILASIVLVGLGGFRSKGRDARRIADLRQVQNALELYFAKNGVYPSATAWGPQTTAGTLSNTLVNENIGVNQVPNDPITDRSYGYCLDGVTGRYAIGAVLEDVNNPALTQVEGPFPCASPPATNPESTTACSLSGLPTTKLCMTL